MQMPQEDLVEKIVWDLECGDSFCRSRSKVEEELVTVAQLHEEAGGRLARASSGHSCPACDDAHLVWEKIFAIRKVDVARPRLHGRYSWVVSRVSEVRQRERSPCPLV
jgi:hypothetical protein